MGTLRNIILTLFFLCFAPSTRCQETLEALHTWQAGAVVTEDAIAAFGGLDSCFLAQPIPDDVWARMQGKTYRPNPHVSRADLRHVRALHIDGDRHIRIGEMICNQRIAATVAQILRQLYQSGYPIQSMLLPDVFDADDERQMRANNSSCFCYRTIAGSQRLSKHSLGLAIDINPLYNPHCLRRRDGTLVVHPTTGLPYADRTRSFPYKITRHDPCHRLFTRHHFAWGGAWRRSKDYQHFEFQE